LKEVRVIIQTPFQGKTKNRVTGTTQGPATKNPKSVCKLSVKADFFVLT